MTRRAKDQPALFPMFDDARPGKERSAAERYREPSLLDAIREAPAPLQRLRHHVTGAIERGEAEPIVEQPEGGTPR